MSGLASYLPSFEDWQDPKDFLDPVDLVEARVAAEQADSNVEAVVDIRASLEALCVSMEANLEADRWTPVFINHSLDAIGRRTGLKFPVASMEDATVSISMEGLGDALKKIWDAIVEAVKSAIKAVKDFFKRIYEFVTGKKSTIENNFAKAKKGEDSTPKTIAKENVASKAPEGLAEKVTELKDDKLSKARPDEIVIVTAPTATALERGFAAEHGERETFTQETVVYKGKHFTATLKKEVEKIKYVKLATAGNDFISHASQAGVKLKSVRDGSCEITMDDLTELVWETLFRGKVMRETGIEISGAVNTISQVAIEGLAVYFKKGGKGWAAWEKDGQHDLKNKLFLRMDAVFSQFKKMQSNNGMIPAGRQVARFGNGNSMDNIYGGRDFKPELADFTDQDVLLEIPTWSKVKKASDGVDSLLVLNLQKNIVDGISKGFDNSLAAWDAAVKWVNDQGWGDETTRIVNAYTALTKSILTYTQNYYNRFMRSQLAMEGTIVQWSGILSGTMARMADSKDAVADLT